nr:ion transporter [Aeropyrum camini]
MARFRRGLTDLGDRVRSIGDVMEHPLVELGVSYAALLSVIVVVVEYTMQLSRDYLIRLYLIDLVLVLILWIDYAYRAYKSGDPRGYLKKTFYEIPTLIPAGLLALIEGHLAGLGFFRLVRLLRLLRILLIISRGSKFLSARSRCCGKDKVLPPLRRCNAHGPLRRLRHIPSRVSRPGEQHKVGLRRPMVGHCHSHHCRLRGRSPSNPRRKMIGIAVMLTGISALTLLIGTVSNMFQRIIGGELEERCTPTKLAEMVSSMSEEEFEDLINTLRSLRRLEKRLD